MLGGWSSTACATFSVLIAGLLCCTSGQELSKGTKPLGSPTDVRTPFWPIGQTLLQDLAMVMWEPPATAQRYLLTINEVHDEERILIADIKNVEETSFTFLELTPATKYEVIVRAVRVEPDGSVTTSAPSEPYVFETLAACAGGREHSPCNARCIATCEDQNPVCPRICSSGCACPRDKKPFLHNDECITKKQCKELGAPIIEVLRRPKNLKVHPLKMSTDVVFTWDEVEGADFYTIIVMLKDGTEIQRIDSNIAFVVIKDLEEGVRYKFRVQAKWIRPSGPQRALGLYSPSVSDVKHTSFIVRWEESEDAEQSYTVTVYRKGAKAASGVFPGLKDTYITIQGLEPNTQYEVTVTTYDEGLETESGRASVKTTDADDDNIYVPEEEFTVSMPTTTIAYTTPAPKTEPHIPTCAEMRSAALAYESSNPDDLDRPVIPVCDSSGNYRSTQCHNNVCYCVEKKRGQKKSGTDFPSKNHKFAINCNALGDFNISPIRATLSAINTRTMKVDWERVNNAIAYTVKVYAGFTSDFVTHVSEITSTEVEIDGLKPGFPYIVVVVALNKDRETSTDKVRGEYIVMPYLDAPRNLVAEQLPESKYKVSWKKAPGAEHYSVEVFENGDTKPSTMYENITANYQVIPVDGKNTYKVAVRSTAVTIIPGSGRRMLVFSNPNDVTFTPRATGDGPCAVRPLDIIFGVDASQKMTAAQFAKAKEIFIKITSGLGNIVADVNAKQGTRIAVVKAFEATRTLFRFDAFDNTKDLIGALKYLKQTQSTKLNVGRMLNTIYTSFFNNANNDDHRKGAETVVINFLGGKSNDAVAQHASKLRSATQVIAIGVKGQSSYLDLTYTASHKDMRIIIPSFDDTDEAYERVMAILCRKKW